MSKIVLIAFSGELSAPTLMAFKRGTGKSLAQLKRAVAAGQPVLEAVLFMNDHDQVARALRTVLDGDVEDVLRMYEIESDAHFEPTAHRDNEIQRSVLDNILAGWNDPPGV